MRVSIIGATGYVGFELVRLLSLHPQAELSMLVSKSYVGKKFSDVYPSMRGVCDIECSDMNLDEIINNSDIVITALPHGISKTVIPPLVDAGVKVIDHSGDFRFDDVAVYEKWYNTEHDMPQLNDIAIYGQPELYRDRLADAKLVGNPGCYPTCSMLPLIPLLKEGIINTDAIVIDAASGVTGAGRKSDLAYAFCETQGNYKAYGIVAHRHTGEIEQELSKAAGKEVFISFTPHLAPFKRGMLATTHALLNKKADGTCYTTDDILEVLHKYYDDETFIRVLDKGVYPEVKNVVGSNYLDIGAQVDARLNRVVLMSAQDNLMKGAAGQAVQVLNIMGGFDEDAGLTAPGLYL